MIRWVSASNLNPICSLLSIPTSANGRRLLKLQRIRQRFTHFVNSDEPDDNIEFVNERGQIRPMNAEERQALLAGSV